MSETETSILSELQVASYAETAAISLALYDFLICLDHEIDVIWKRKLNLSTVLYLALRYLGLLVVISTALSYMNMSISNLGCLSMWWISEVGGYILVFLVQATMIMRLYALSRKSLSVLTFLMSCFLIQQVARIAIFASEYDGVVVNEFGLYTCMVGLNTSIWVVSFEDATTVGFQTLILILTLYYFAKYQQLTHQRISVSLLSKDDLCGVLVRDNVLFCFLYNIPRLLGLISLNLDVEATGLTVVQFSTQVLWMSVIGPRTILNLRMHVTQMMSRGIIKKRFYNRRRRDVELAITVHTETVTFL